MSEPVRSLVVHDIDLNDIAAMERWYATVHAPEIVRRYGPWLARHESFLPVLAPPEAQALGLYNWRVTDGWWRSLPKPGPQGALSFTDPPAPLSVATCFIPWQPTEDFLGSEAWPSERPILRWVILYRYPEGVDHAAAERWFLEVHAPQAATQPGLTRFFSYQVDRSPHGLPGTWRKGSAPPRSFLPHWDRVIEFWYEDFRAWERAVLKSPPRYTAPAWATRPAFPFVEPGTHLVSSFILERPNDEFLRDFRIYPA